MSREKLWTKEFIILSLVNFFVMLVFFLLNATITVYAVNEYHTSSTLAGIIAGIFVIGALFGRLLINTLSQTKLILIICLVLFSLTTVLYFIDLGENFLIITRFLNGITGGMTTTFVGTIVAISLPVSKKGEGISYFAISTALATGLGPLIGVYMSQTVGFDMIFTLCLLLGIISLITACVITIPAKEVKVEENPKKRFALSNLIEPKALPIAIVIFIMTFCYSGILSYINLYAVEIDLVDAAGFFFIVYTAAVLVSRPFTGRIMDKKGANIIMYPAFILYAGGLLLLSFTTNSIMLLLAGALIGLGFGNISSVSQTIAVSLSEPHRMGLATATFYIFFDLGNGIGPTIWGSIISKSGYNSLYLILSIIVFISLIIYFLLHGKQEQPNQKPLKIH